ncbi:hypothetical protein ACFQX6_35165 [Streptosporangium lutulentum]
MAVISVVVVGIAVGAFFAYQSFSSRNQTSASSSIPTAEIIDPTGDPVPEPDPINTTMLDSEKTDPGKLTVPDAFTKKVTLAGATFTRVKTNITEDCPKAAAASSPACWAARNAAECCGPPTWTANGDTR